VFFYVTLLFVLFFVDFYQMCFDALFTLKIFLFNGLCIVLRENFQHDFLLFFAARRV